MAVLNEALSKNPDDKGVHSELAKLHLSNGAADESLIEGHLRRGFSTGDGNFEARFDLGQFLFAKGDMAGAVEQFDYIDKKAPDTFRPVAAKRETVITDRIGERSGYVQNINGHFFFIRAGSYPREFFAHKSSIVEGNFDQLAQGDNVRFSVRFNRKGPVAIDIKLT